MTRTEQERLVERYLNGEMNSADEQEFFIQVAVDNNLRQTLKAYRIVESAIRKHRDAVPSRHAELRSTVVDMLRATSVAPGAPASPGMVAPRTTPPGTGATARAGSATYRWLITAVAALGFTVAGFVVASIVGTAPEETTPSSGAYQKHEGAAGTPGSPAAEAPAPTVVLPQQGTGDAVPATDSRGSAGTTSEGAARNQPVRPEGRKERSSSAGTERTSVRSEHTAAAQTEAPVDAAQPVSAKQPEVSAPPASEGSGRQEPVLQRKSNDTVKMKIEFGTPKERRR